LTKIDSCELFSLQWNKKPILSQKGPLVFLMFQHWHKTFSTLDRVK
jgi:hypothetical protein